MNKNGIIGAILGGFSAYFITQKVNSKQTPYFVGAMGALLGWLIGNNMKK